MMTTKDTYQSLNLFTKDGAPLPTVANRKCLGVSQPERVKNEGNVKTHKEADTESGDSRFPEKRS